MHGLNIDVDRRTAGAAAAVILAVIIGVVLLQGDGPLLPEKDPQAIDIENDTRGQAEPYPYGFKINFGPYIEEVAIGGVYAGNFFIRKWPQEEPRMRVGPSIDPDDGIMHAFLTGYIDTDRDVFVGQVYVDDAFLEEIDSPLLAWGINGTENIRQPSFTEVRPGVHRTTFEFAHPEVFREDYTGDGSLTMFLGNFTRTTLASQNFVPQGARKAGVTMVYTQ